MMRYRKAKSTVLSLKGRVSAPSATSVPLASRRHGPIPAGEPLQFDQNLAHWRDILGLALAVAAMSTTGWLVLHFHEVDAHQINGFRSIGAAICVVVYMLGGFGGRRWR